MKIMDESAECEQFEDRQNKLSEKQRLILPDMRRRY